VVGNPFIEKAPYKRSPLLYFRAELAGCSSCPGARVCAGVIVLIGLRGTLCTAGSTAVSVRATLISALIAATIAATRIIATGGVAVAAGSAAVTAISAVVSTTGSLSHH